MGEMQDLVGVGGVPVILVLVVVVSRALRIAKRVRPLVAVGCGVGLNLALASVLGGSLDRAFVVGLLAGLAASGLWSGAKHMGVR